MEKNTEIRKEWARPDLNIYGDMTVLTQGVGCQKPNAPNPCKPKTFGFGDDFSNNISTV